MSLGSEARKAWDRCVCRADVKWLQNTDWISAHVFQPPTTYTWSHAWERIAVPPAMTGLGKSKIYKRVAGKAEDLAYDAVVMELESHELGQRKRAKSLKSAVDRSAVHQHDPVYEAADRNGAADILTARSHVREAYKAIAVHNEHILFSSLPRPERSTCDPSTLAWIPRKRHNTRWPIKPPDMNGPMMAELQPLVRLELQLCRIDDPEYCYQYRPNDPPQSEQPRVRQVPARKRSRHCLSIVRRPLPGRITEGDEEPAEIPLLKPGTERYPLYSSPAKRWSAIADSFHLPTNVASSSLKNFNITATPSQVVVEDAIKLEEERETVDDAAQALPIKPVADTVESAPLGGLDKSASDSKAILAQDNRNPEHFFCPSSPSTPWRILVASHSPASVAVFDQPTPEVPVVHEYEIKRRILLHAARRSDRQSDPTILKRARRLVARAVSNSRRSFTNITHEPERVKPVNRRCHAVDVDVGKTPDIFGQRLIPHDVDTNAPFIHTDAVAMMDVKSPRRIVHDDIVCEALSPERLVSMESTQERFMRQNGVPPSVPKRELPQQEEDDAGNGTSEADLSRSRLVTTSNAVKEHVREDWNEDFGQDASDIVRNLHDCQVEVTFKPCSPRLYFPGPMTVDELLTDEGGLVMAEQGKEESEEENVTPDDDVEDESDDSELGVLRNFVRRAQLKPKRALPPTSAIGSIIAKADKFVAVDSPPRAPLGEKDTNRRRPTANKKRGLKDAAEDVLIIAPTKRSCLVKPDLDDTTPQTQRKRRRAGSELDAPNDVFNPDMDLCQNLTQRGSSVGLRRSKRVATTKAVLEPVAVSHISVRLCGSSIDADLPAVCSTGLMQHQAEKDLARLTRNNTNRNRAGAVSVSARLAGLSQPSVGRATAGAADVFSPATVAAARQRGGKTLRWAETLARYQGDEEDCERMPTPPQLRSVGQPARPPNPVAEQLDAASVSAPLSWTERPSSPGTTDPADDYGGNKKALRPRPSRLPALASTAATPKKKTGRQLPAPGPTVSRVSSTGASTKPPAVPRAWVQAEPRGGGGGPLVTPACVKRPAVLGARLGTPAPKRRGRQ